MPTRYTVQQGDCVVSLAHANGLLPEQIWNHPANASLKAKRQDLSVLMPGDILTIPDKQPGSRPAQTNKLNTFVRKAVPAKLKLRFVDSKGDSRVDVPFRLEVDGKTVKQGVTDGQGGIEANIPCDARSGMVILNQTEIYPLNLGTLDPSTEKSGVTKRLQNLGLLSVDCDDDDEKNARIAFKIKYCGASPDIDPHFTKSDLQKLVEIHGS